LDRLKKVLIANRGEIAVRVARTCRVMGIATVAVYSEADAGALHTRVADEAVPIGPAEAARSYLSIDALLAAARRTGADAIHPGYGFLSQNGDFADACAEAGLVFIGPPGDVHRRMGDKQGARRLMASAGVPVVPGYDGDEQQDEALLREAGRIGWPVMIKPSRGGGGKGLRIVREAGQFVSSLQASRREAKAAFGDDRVFAERYVERPRHVEIQLLGDANGEVVSLGERECSVQRRHQKLIEESPSAALTPELRQQMGEVSIRGPNVTPGYEANPEANAQSFRNGWFRTGDEGVLDEEGYLRLTGRIKEQINRGGEKFSPLEVDDVLSSHPAVAQALTFAMPHDKLGEEVAAAVVLREGATATERELRHFCASRLADFKVPRKVVLLTEIPKGATGKLQRIGLAQKLGLGS